MRAAMPALCPHLISSSPFRVSYQKIRPSLTLFVALCLFLFDELLEPRPAPVCRTTPCRLSVTVYYI